MSTNKTVASSKSWAPPIKTLLLFFLGGVIAGALAQGAAVLEGPLLELTTLTGPWVAIAAIIGCRAPTRAMGGTRAVVFLIGMVTCFYAVYALRSGMPPLALVAFWLAASIAVGYPLGLLGWWSSRDTRGAAISVSIITGLLLGEAARFLIPQNLKSNYWLVVTFDLVAGIAFLLLTPLARRRRVQAITITLFSTATVAAFYLILLPALAGMIFKIQPSSMPPGQNTQLSTAQVREIIGDQGQLRDLGTYSTSTVRSIFGICQASGLHGALSWIASANSATGNTVTTDLLLPGTLAEVTTLVAHTSTENAEEATMKALHECGDMNAQRTVVQFPNGTSTKAIEFPSGGEKDRLTTTLVASQSSDSVRLVLVSRNSGAAFPQLSKIMETALYGQPSGMGTR